MKKLVAIAAVLMLMLTFAVTASAAAPENELFEATLLTDFADRADGIADLRGADGWSFSGEQYTDWLAEFKDHRMVVSMLDGIITTRLSLTAEQKAIGAAENLDNMDALGFYIENNSQEAIGLAYFGEITYTLPELQEGGLYHEEFAEYAENAFGHQQTYNETDFENIECYLVDLDGNIAIADEYTEDWGHGYAEIPAGFKGYYICTLDTLGHDCCYYAAWGSEADKGHSMETCEGGKYRKGASIETVGFSIMNFFPEDEDNYVVGDYFLVKLGDGFERKELGFGDDEPTTTEPAETEPTETEPTETEPAESEPAESEPAATEPAATDAPGNGTTDNTGLIVGIIAAVVVVAAVIIIVVVSKKKKKA